MMGQDSQDVDIRGFDGQRTPRPASRSACQSLSALFLMFAAFFALAVVACASRSRIGGVRG